MQAKQLAGRINEAICTHVNGLLVWKEPQADLTPGQINELRRVAENIFRDALANEYDRMDAQ